MDNFKAIQFNCYFCSKGLRGFADYEKHLLSHTKEFPFKCKLCTLKQRQYKGLFSLLKHYKKYHPDLYLESRVSRQKSIYECYFCGCTFKIQSNLFRHLATHTREFQFKCEFLPCTKRKLHKSTIMVHQKSCYFNPNRQLRERILPCYFCGQKCKTMSSLLNHSRRHTDEKPFKCCTCNKQFTTPVNLNYHIKSCHDLESRYKCSFCDTEKIYLEDLNSHIRSKHTKDHKLHKCYFCFKQLERVTPKHMALHTGEQLYGCKYCPAYFQTAVPLYFHILEHVDTPECEKAKSFISKSKPMCYFCLKRFPNKGYIERHMKTHTGEKSYDCKRCRAILFSWSAAMKCCRKPRTVQPLGIHL